MILGLSTSAFTQAHVVVSLVAMVSGLIVVLGMLGAKRLEGWTLVFLVTMVATSASGFLFPTASFDPPKVVGVLSLAALALAIAARYFYHLAGAWRWIYVISALLALYFDVFVGVVQAFQKLSLLQPLAPTQSEPPFVVVQVVVILLFIGLGWADAVRFHPDRTGLA